MKVDRLLYVPTEEEIRILIANTGKKYALVLSILRDTGMRPIELHRSILEWYDLKQGFANVETAKGGRGRTLELKPRTLAMLKEHVGKHKVGLKDHSFAKVKTMRREFKNIKYRTVEKFQRPELLKISLYSFRHCFGTMLYHRTKEILYV
jgi:integrase